MPPPPSPRAANPHPPPRLGGLRPGHSPHRPPALPVAASPPPPPSPLAICPQVHAPCAACGRHSAYPSRTPTPSSPRLPAPSRPLYTPAPHPRRRPSPRLSHPTAPPDPRQPYPTRQPPRPAATAPPDAQPHRAAPPHAVPRANPTWIRMPGAIRAPPPPPPPAQSATSRSRDSRCTPTLP